MKIYKIISIITLLILWSGICVFGEDKLPFAKGEKIGYSLKWGGIKIGNVESTFLGKDSLNGENVYVFTFQTKAASFDDLDKIYGDPEGFYPLLIERTIKMGGKKIEIIEEYDQKQYSLKITKKSSDMFHEQVIKRNSKIQNVVLLFYYCRSQNLKVGDSFSVVLPCVEYNVKVVKEEEVNLAIGKRKAYLFETDPGAIKLWIGTEPDKLLLKIENPIIFGRLVMEIKDINY